MSIVIRIIGVALEIIGVLVWAGIVVLIILTYFVVSYEEGITYDYWGRERFDAPFLLQWIGIYDHPGLLWWIGDIIIALTLLAIGAGLRAIGNYLIGLGKK